MPPNSPVIRAGSPSAGRRPLNRQRVAGECVGWAARQSKKGREQMADTPTVGRIVHFINGKNEQVEHAAIITKVLGSDIVNLGSSPPPMSMSAISASWAACPSTQK